MRNNLFTLFFKVLFNVKEMRIFIVLLLVIGASCSKDRANYDEDMVSVPESEIPFNKEKWLEMDGKDYPHRDKMVNTLLYSDSLRSLKKNEIFNMLGEPSYYRTDSSFLHYRISETRLISWILHTRTLVIKLSATDSVEWIKIHE